MMQCENCGNILSEHEEYHYLELGVVNLDCMGSKYLEKQARIGLYCSLECLKESLLGSENPANRSGKNKEEKM
jgi:hypothetical protein